MIQCVVLKLFVLYVLIVLFGSACSWSWCGVEWCDAWWYTASGRALSSKEDEPFHTCASWCESLCDHRSHVACGDYLWTNPEKWKKYFSFRVFLCRRGGHARVGGGTHHRYGDWGSNRRTRENKPTKYNIIIRLFAFASKLFNNPIWQMSYRP